MKRKPSQLLVREHKGFLRQQNVMQALVVVIVLLGAICPGKSLAQAQTLSYSGPQTYTAGMAVAPLVPVSTGITSPVGYPLAATNVGAGIIRPYGIATDKAGNVFVADPGNDGVMEIPVGGGPAKKVYTSSSVGAITIDTAENLYVIDGSTVKKLQPFNGIYATYTIIGSGFQQPLGIAVDQAGNVYVADIYKTSIVEIVAGKVNQSSVGYGFKNPGRVAVDGAGNVYVADSGNEEIKMVPVGGSTPVVLGQGENVIGVAADFSGNVFKVDAGNGVITLTNPLAQVGPVFTHPVNATVDGAGNLYAVDDSTHEVLKVKPAGGYFISPGLPAGLKFDPGSGTISGTPLTASPAKNYTITAYNAVGSVAATVNIKIGLPSLPAIGYNTNQTYTAGTAIVPLTPVSTGVSAPGYNRITVTKNLNVSNPYHLSLDSMGNFYVLNLPTTIYRFPPAGGTGVVIGPNNVKLWDMAADAGGDVFEVDSVGGFMKEYRQIGGSWVQSNDLNVASPYSIAVNRRGSAIFAGEGTGSIDKLYPNLMKLSQGSVGVNSAPGLAVDEFNNVFAAGGSSLVKLPADGSNYISLSSSFSAATGVAIDAVGNVFVADKLLNAVTMLPVSGSAPVNIGSGFIQPTGVAIDRSGNVYVADGGPNEGEIKEITLAGGYTISPALPAGLSLDNTTGIISGTATTASSVTTYTITGANPAGSQSVKINITVNLPPAPTLSYSSPHVYNTGTAITPLVPTNSHVDNFSFNNQKSDFGGGFSSPYAVSADAAGNVYILDNNGLEQIAAGQSEAVNLNVGLTNMTGVVADKTGNLYITGNGATGYVSMLPVGGGGPVTIATGFKGLTGIAIDAGGSLYVVDNGNNVVEKLSTPLTAGETPVIIGSGFNYPVGVAVDQSGNVYVTDRNHGALRKISVGGSITTIASGIRSPAAMTIDAAGNIYFVDSFLKLLEEIPAGGSMPVTLQSGFYSPDGVAVDAVGNILISDVLYATNNSIWEIKPVGGYYINSALPAGLTFSRQTGIVSGTPVATASSSAGYTVTAYNAAGEHSATFNLTINAISLSYSSPQSFLKGQAITPLAPSAAGVAAPAYSASPVVVGSGFNSPDGIAVDAAGNVYVADVGSNSVKKIPAGGGATLTLAAGFTSPAGLAVDAAGNVYVSDQGSNSVKKIPAGGGPVVVLATGFNTPAGLAVDFAGNVYVADFNNNAVKKILAGGGNIVTIGSGFTNPAGVAVNSAGDVLVADETNHAVKIIPASGGGVFSLGSGFGFPTAIAVDPSGYVYVTDAGNNTVKKILQDGVSVVTVSSGFNNPNGVAVDALGNVYVADEANNLIKETVPVGGYYLGTALPAGLYLDNATGVISGTPTTASAAANYAVTAYNALGGVSAVVNIAVTASSVATLSAMGPGIGPLSPVFTPATTSYTLSVPYATATMTVKPVTTDTHATIKVNGTTLASGTTSAAIALAEGTTTAINVVVTAQDGVTTKTYTITVTRAPSIVATLSSIGSSVTPLTPVFNPATASYTLSVSNATATMTVKPVTTDAHATIKVNGTTVVSGTTSGAIALAEGTTTAINVVVTAQDGATTKTYTITVTRAPSIVATLSSIGSSVTPLTPVFNPATTGYTLSVSNATATMTVKPVTTDANATIKVNGTALVSGTTSAALPLAEGTSTAINVVVTAQNGANTKTYTITVTRAPSSVATLSGIGSSITPLTPVFNPATTSYTLSVANSVTSMTVKPVTTDAHATIKVNGTATPSGTTFGPIALAVGSNTITTVVTAQDGAATKTYTITVTRASAGADSFNPGISVTKPTKTPTLAEDGIVVHQGISPNGDGVNDFLQIDNISQYPDNKLMIMNRNGQLVYEAKGYDNSTRIFDGHSTKNGQMQVPGTYFYQLDYTVNGTAKHKTGFIVLKY